MFTSYAACNPDVPYRVSRNSYVGFNSEHTHLAWL